MQYARQQVIDSAELNSKLFSLVIPVILRESSGVSVLPLRAGDHLIFHGIQISEMSGSTSPPPPPSQGKDPGNEVAPPRPQPQPRATQEQEKQLLPDRRAPKSASQSTVTTLKL